jgi:hypothetical protein
MESPTTSRRAVVLGAVSMPAIAAPVAAASAPDPIFPLIESHKAAYSALSDANHRQCEIENALYDAGKPIRDARKDPRWDELQHEIDACDAELTSAASWRCCATFMPTPKLAVAFGPILPCTMGSCPAMLRVQDGAF